MSRLLVAAVFNFVLLGWSVHAAAKEQQKTAKEMKADEKKKADIISVAKLMEEVKEGSAASVQAMAALSWFHLEGRGGLKQNYKEAASLAQKAADQSNAEGQFVMGILHQSGYANLDPSPEKVIAWFQKAVDQGHLEAHFHLAGMRVNNGEPDYKGAMKLLKKAGKAGHAKSQFDLSLVYLTGPGGLQRDDAKALKWCRKAAALEHPEAMMSMGTFYNVGQLGLPRDDNQAFMWYQKAADTEHDAAQAAVAEFYENGRGVEKSAKKAAQWYKRAEGNGYKRNPNDVKIAEAMMKKSNGKGEIHLDPPGAGKDDEEEL